MVNIFGIKLFEGSSMHNKSRRQNHSKKRHLKGGYIYDNAGSPEDDITSRLSSVLSESNSKSKSKSNSKSKSKSKYQNKGKRTRKYSSKTK
jgi:hypothetical protein